MIRILVLEDDEYIRSGLCTLLSNQGYEVEGVGTVAAFFQSVKSQPDRDMYLIDVMLPDGNGFEVCSELRKTSQAAIIFLTSCDDEDSIIKGLDLGADDYVTKPFRVAELMSRVQANLRRLKFKTGTYEVSQGKEAADSKDCAVKDEVNLDLDRYEVTKRGEVINLSPMEFELLRLLMANKGLIVRRELILEKLWDNSGNFVEDGTLTVTVSRLKSKLGDREDGKPFIETIRGVGYRWRQV